MWWERVITTFFFYFLGTEELKKIVDHQNVISRAQTYILEKLSEPNIVSNSGLSEDECICTPCPEDIGSTDL